MRPAGSHVRNLSISLALIAASVLAAPGVRAASQDLALERNAVPTSNVNLREAPNAFSLIRSIVSEGEELIVRGNPQLGYLPVFHGEESGWIFLDLLAVDPLVQVQQASQPMATGPREATTVETLNLRDGPGTEFNVIRELSAGTTVIALPEVDGRYQKIQVGDEVGWVRSIYLDGLQHEDDSAPLSDVNSIAVPGDSGQLKATLAAEVNLRAEADSDSTKLDVVSLGASVTLTGRRAAGFAEVTYRGQTGWLYEAYLDLEHKSEPLNLPVLMYHSIQELGGEYQITPWQLEEQIAWLSNSGYTSITSRDLLAWIVYGVPLPDKPVMITIDDGNPSDWYMLEVLDRYNMEGVFFIPDYVGLSAAQVRTLARAGEVCGHTVSHPILSTLDYHGQYTEILANKEYLEGILGEPVTCFAYPFGDYNPVTNYAVTDAGYLLAFNAWGGPVDVSAPFDRWHITRINVNGFHELSDFIASLGE